MKIVIPTAALLNAASDASAVAAAKSPKPILECVRIHADKTTGVSFEATDLDVAIRVHLPDAEVKKAGEVVVSAQRFQAIVREITEESTTLQGEGQDLQVKTGGSRFRIRGDEPGDFPEIPAAPDSRSARIPANLFKHMVRRTAFATAKEAGRFALHGVMLKLDGKKIEMVATDGRRLARIEAQLDAKGKKAQVILGPRGLQLLERVIGGDETPVDVTFGDRQVIFASGSTLVSSRLIDGTFPSLDGVIPAPRDTAFVTKVADLAAGLRRASLLTTREAISVELSIAPGSLAIRSRARDVGEAEVAVPVSGDVSEARMGLNPHFLQDALKVMDPESDVRFEYTDDKAPGRLTDRDDYTYVIMPIALE